MVLFPDIFFCYAYMLRTAFPDFGTRYNTKCTLAPHWDNPSLDIHIKKAGRQHCFKCNMYQETPQHQGGPKATVWWMSFRRRRMRRRNNTSMTVTQGLHQNNKNGIKTCRTILMGFLVFIVNCLLPASLIDSLVVSSIRPLTGLLALS